MFLFSYPEVLITYCTCVFCSLLYIFFFSSFLVLMLSSNICNVIIKKNNHKKKVINSDTLLSFNCIYSLQIRGAFPKASLTNYGR